MLMFTTFLAWTVIEHGGLLLARAGGRPAGRARARRGRGARDHPPGRGRAAAQRRDRHARPARGAAGHGGHDLGRHAALVPAARSSIRGSTIGGTRLLLAPYGPVRVRSRRGRRPRARGTVPAAPTSGCKMRAAAFAPEVARLLGVRVGRMLTLGWALAALVGSAGRGAGRPVGVRRPEPVRLGPRVRLHRRGHRRPGQRGRRRRRAGSSSAARSATCRATSAPTSSRSAPSWC